MVWEFPFENTISKGAQMVMYNLLILGNSVVNKKLMTSVMNFSKDTDGVYSDRIDERKYRLYLKELDGSFIKTSRDFENNIKIDYQNPSVQDFLVNYIDRNELLKCDLVKNATYLDALLRIFAKNEFGMTRFHNSYRLTTSSSLKDILDNKIISDFDKNITSLTHWKSRGSKEDIIVYLLDYIIHQINVIKGNKLDMFLLEKYIDILYEGKLKYNIIAYINLLLRYKNDLEIDLDRIMNLLICCTLDCDDLLAFSDLEDINLQIYNSFLEKEYDRIEVIIDDIVSDLGNSDDDI